MAKTQRKQRDNETMSYTRVMVGENGNVFFLAALFFFNLSIPCFDTAPKVVIDSRRTSRQDFGRPVFIATWTPGENLIPL